MRLLVILDPDRVPVRARGQVQALALALAWERALERVQA